MEGLFLLLGSSGLINIIRGLLSPAEGRRGELFIIGDMNILFAGIMGALPNIFFPIEQIIATAVSGITLNIAGLMLY